jgi:hypothetical protein
LRRLPVLWGSQSWLQAGFQPASPWLDEFSGLRCTMPARHEAGENTCAKWRAIHGDNWPGPCGAGFSLRRASARLESDHTLQTREFFRFRLRQDLSGKAREISRVSRKPAKAGCRLKPAPQKEPKSPWRGSRAHLRRNRIWRSERPCRQAKPPAPPESQAGHSSMEVEV